MAQDTGLFSPEEDKVYQRVSRSQIWKLIRDALAYEREQLFAVVPTSSEELWRTWGAIGKINTLLHQGPAFVVFYHRHMQSKAETRDDPGVSQLVSEVPSRPNEPPDLE